MRNEEFTNDELCDLFHSTKISDGKFYLKVKKLNKYGNILQPSKHGDAGFDVLATKDIVLAPQERFNMPLGIALEFPEEYVCIVHGKSGLAKHLGIDTIGNCVDSGYRGEIHAQLVNTSSKTISIENGQKCAQLVFHKCYTCEPEFVDKLSDTDRGVKGFGSTGK